jgi:hypothetical protein
MAALTTVAVLLASTTAAPAEEISLAEKDLSFNPEVLNGQAHAHLTSVMAGDFEGLTQPNPGRKGLVGLFVSSCKDFNCAEGSNSPVVPCSSLLVTHYMPGRGKVQGYTWDITFYLNDYTCTPKNSDVLAKLSITGDVTYSGMSNLPANSGGTLVTYQPQNGTFLFNFVNKATNWVANLNKNCPCDGGWIPARGQNVIRRKIASLPKSCANTQPDRGALSLGDLCNWISGRPWFTTYKWLDGNHLVQAAGRVDNQKGGWAVPFNKTDDVESLLPHTGEYNSKNCTYLVWPQCKTAVTTAATMCQSCTNPMECSGCIYEELPASLGKEHEWDTCCPCMWYYAQHNKGYGFMQVPC